MAIYHDGGSNNPHLPDFTNINVEPDNLGEFADLLDSDLKAIADTWNRLTSDLGRAERPADEDAPADEEFRELAPNFGGSPVPDDDDGIREGGAFREAYYRTLFAEWKLMRELIKGLEILRDAAQDIHDGYVRSDAANADSVEDTFTAYEQWRVTEALNERRAHPGT